MQAKNRLVVSNRRAMVENQMRELNPGEVVTGIVRGIKPYGLPRPLSLARLFMCRSMAVCDGVHWCMRGGGS
jgi:hypothetical protein